MDVRTTHRLPRLFLALSLILPVAAFATERGGPTVLTIHGTNLGPIPDRGNVGCGPPSGPVRDIAFNVAGFSGTVVYVDVLMAFNPAHTWMGDIEATLIAPNGVSHVLFGRIGSTTTLGCGDSSDLLGPYVFSDAATPPSGGFWQAATAAGTITPVASGSYFTTDPGGAGAINPMPPTSLAAAFSGLNGTQASGTWILRVADFGGGDTGTISAATLRLIIFDIDVIFRDGFESP